MIKTLLLTASFLLCCLTGYAAIALDATSTGTATSATSKTVSHTCTGSNLLLAVYAVGRDGGGGAYASGVTYNSVAMTEITGSRGESSDNRGSWWYLIAPSTGTNDIVVSYGGTMDSIGVMAHSYTGAKQSSQPDASSSGAGNEASDSIADTTITTVADNSVIVSAAVGNEDWGAWSAVSPFTDRQSANAATRNQSYSSDYTKASAGSQEVDWNVINFENWAVSNASFSPAITSTTQAIIVQDE